MRTFREYVEGRTKIYPWKSMSAERRMDAMAEFFIDYVDRVRFAETDAGKNADLKFTFTKPVHRVRVVIEDGFLRLHGFDSDGNIISRCEQPLIP